LIDVNYIDRAVNVIVVHHLEVFLPKYSLISAFCEHATKPVKQIRILKVQNEKLRTAPDLLLPRLMNGEIEV